MSEVKAGKMHDMTVGSPVKLILHFMVPVFLGNVFQQFYNVADSIIAGQFLGVRALAAIGSTGSLMFFVTGWLNGLTSGFAILVAQWFGAKEYERMRHYVAMSVYLSLGFAVLMTIGLGLANVPILRLMNYSDEIMPDVKAYMGIIYAGLVVTAAYNALAAFLRALGDSKSPLYFLIISAMLNVALDLLFVGVLGMGVGGAAFATVISQAVSAFLGLRKLMKATESYRLIPRKIRFNGRMLQKVLYIGIPSGLQNAVIALANVVVQTNINDFGALAQAGCGAYSKIEGFGFLPITSFTLALTTFIGQNLGAQE